MKNTYHMGCFLCCQCHQPIGTGSFHNEDGKIYCPKGISPWRPVVLASSSHCMLVQRVKLTIYHWLCFTLTSWTTLPNPRWCFSDATINTWLIFSCCCCFFFTCMVHISGMLLCCRNCFYRVSKNQTAFLGAITYYFEILSEWLSLCVFSVTAVHVSWLKPTTHLKVSFLWKWLSKATFERKLTNVS